MLDGKLITISVTDGEREWTNDYYIENEQSFDDIVEMLEKAIDKVL